MTVSDANTLCLQSYFLAHHSHHDSVLHASDSTSTPQDIVKVLLTINTNPLAISIAGMNDYAVGWPEDGSSQYHRRTRGQSNGLSRLLGREVERFESFKDVLGVDLSHAERKLMAAEQEVSAARAALAETQARIDAAKMLSNSHTVESMIKHNRHYISEDAETSEPEMTKKEQDLLAHLSAKAKRKSTNKDHGNASKKSRTTEPSAFSKYLAALTTGVLAGTPESSNRARTMRGIVEGSAINDSSGEPSGKVIAPSVRESKPSINPMEATYSWTAATEMDTAVRGGQYRGMLTSIRNALTALANGTKLRQRYGCKSRTAEIITLQPLYQEVWDFFTQDSFVKIITPMLSEDVIASIDTEESLRAFRDTIVQAWLAQNAD